MAVNLPQPIKMEDQSIKTEIIDLDDYISPEEAVFRLHIKVRNKFKSLYGDESEDTLNNIMKWYIETLNEDSFEIEACQSFIRNMRKHIHFFHGCFKELTWISVDNYLDTMEDILALYLDFECEFFIKHPRKEQILSKNLLQVLRIYLLHQNDRVFNVLLKIKLNLTSDRAKQFLDNIFKMALSPVPINTTDIAFCRAYILHHRWKKVLNPGMYKIIDDLLYKHYSQTPNAVNTNPVLKEVLQPQNDSLLDILAHIMDNDKILCESYFKYVKTQKIQEDLIGDVNNIDIDGRISPSYYNKEDIDGTTEEIETSLFGNVTNVNSRKTHDSLNEDVIKMEESDDDDCVIVGEGTVDCDPDETEIVHEILDDDDDIEAIIYFTAKEPTPKKPPSVQKTTPVPEEISFLNSINVREVKSNKENTNSNVRSQCISISPTSFSSQNLDNDSVKSREILSRKFTRKKVDDLTEDIVIEDADNSTCTVLDVDDNDWDQSKPNDNESEEPSHIFEGLVTPPTSHDDQHGYERDFHNDHMQNSYEEKVNVKEMENSCLTPHSTNCGNLDFCNDSTSVPEKIIHESYVSPTSPDISSTCELNDLIGDEPEMTSEPSEHNIELANTVDDQSTVNSRIMMENCSKENNPFSDIQIGTTYSVNLPDNDFIETVPLADSSKDKQALNDSTEENRSANDSVKESDILSREIEDAQLKHILGDVTSVTEYPEAVNTFRSDSPPVLSLQEKDTDNQFILNQIDSYIQENTTNESVEENVIADGSVLNKSNSPVQKETIEDKHVQIEEVNNSLVKENSVAGDTLDFKTFTNNCVKEKTRINGEHNRSEENERNFLSKQLKVSIPPLDIIKSPEKKMNVIFTSKRNNINKLETEVHLRYNELKGEHGLDDCLNGTLDKINCQSNLDNDFDLFDDNISIGEQEINMPLLNSSNTTTSPSSIVSPEFDKIDDFKNYLTSYQENSKKALKNSPGSHLLEKAPRTNYSETPRPILKSDNNKNLLVPQTKRKRIAFAEEDIIHTPDIQEPIINHTSQVQGILKKSAMSPTLRIPKEHMNMQSLAHFRVKPTDYYLQSNPCVVIERLSEMEIKEWQRVTEKSRRKRLLKQKNSQALSSLAVSNMTMFRVDYDKQSPFITSSVTVRYKAPEEQNWRSNARDPKINPHDEGNLAYNGRKNGKRKMQSQSVSGQPPEVRKRGRPRKKT